MATPKSRRRASTLAWSRQVFFIFLTSVSMRVLCTPAPQLTGYIHLVTNLEVWTTQDKQGRNMTCTYTSQIIDNGTAYPISISRPIQWYLNGSILPVTGTEYYIPGDSVSARGRYTCRVSYSYRRKNEQGRHSFVEFSRDLVLVSTQFEYDQVLRPRFVNASLEPPYGVEIASSKLRLQAGDYKLFDCLATARALDPFAPISPLYYEVLHNGTRQVSSAVFTVGPVQPNDAGQWQCVVRNAYGTIRHNFVATVTPGPPGFIPMTPPRTSEPRTSSEEISITSSVSSSSVPVASTGVQSSTPTSAVENMPQPESENNGATYVVYALGAMAGLVTIVLLVLVVQKIRFTIDAHNAGKVHVAPNNNNTKTCLVDVENAIIQAHPSEQHDGNVGELSEPPRIRKADDTAQQREDVSPSAAQQTEQLTLLPDTSQCNDAAEISSVNVVDFKDSIQPNTTPAPDIKGTDQEHGDAIGTSETTSWRQKPESQQHPRLLSTSSRNSTAPLLAERQISSSGSDCLESPTIGPDHPCLVEKGGANASTTDAVDKKVVVGKDTSV
eukprot:scpid16170/ scgid17521/ 